MDDFDIRTFPGEGLPVRVTYHRGEPSMIEVGFSEWRITVYTAKMLVKKLQTAIELIEGKSINSI